MPEETHDIRETLDALELCEETLDIGDCGAGEYIGTDPCMLLSGARIIILTQLAKQASRPEEVKKKGVRFIRNDRCTRHNTAHHRMTSVKHHYPIHCTCPFI